MLLGIEPWFWLAVASAVFGGISAYTHKVAAARNADINVLNVYSSLISAAILFVCTWYFSDFDNFWTLSTLIALIGSATYLITLVLKVQSLKEIDAAIFFPIYKVTGPLLAILFGIVFFNESFTTFEWIGLLVSLCVPLMLITKAEQARQKNLYRGITILLLAAVVGSASIAIFKFGTDITLNVWLYLLVSDIFLAVSSIVILLRKHQHHTVSYMRQVEHHKSYTLIATMGITQAVGAISVIFAFVLGGALGIVYTINSLYILIPIVLAIIFYNEHWNLQKVLAIILSVAALALLG